MLRPKLWLTVTAVGVALLGLTQCVMVIPDPGQDRGKPTVQGAKESPAPQVEDVSAPDEKTLTIRFWQAPTIANPYLGSSQMDRDAAAITLESLAVRNPDAELVPKLAMEIPSWEN